jgi:hypothetical protein
MVKVEVMMDEKSIHARTMLHARLIKLSFALFFILIGGAWFLESIHNINVDQKWAFIYTGTGGILLLLNLLRFILKIKISKFTIALGTIGVLIGFSKYYPYLLPEFSIWAAILLIIGIFMFFEVIRK